MATSPTIGSGEFILAKAVKNAEAAPAPAQASEPPEADPRAWMKSHLYWVAQTSSDLHLRRDFPRYKTMLDGWDSQSLSWQANKAAMAEHFGVTTKDLRREWDAAEQAILEEQGSRAQPRPDEQAQQGPSDQALALWKVSPSVKTIRCLLI